jgi:aminopeptidase N
MRNLNKTYGQPGNLLRVAVVALAVVSLAVPVPAWAGRRVPHFTPGAPGGGDPRAPLDGNGGYQVSRYDLSLAYDPNAERLAGTARILATATQDLSTFDLDFLGLTVSGVTVAGRQAQWDRQGQELRIIPPDGLPNRTRFTVTVIYQGTPETLSAQGSPFGFVPTDDGVFIASGRQTSPTWFPCNNTPTDKALFSIAVQVPRGLGVVANGTLVSERTSADTVTFRWDEKRPMATYLATVDIGKWVVRSGRTPGGVPEYVAVDPRLANKLPNFWDTTARVTDAWTRLFGPYPFDSTGAIVDDAVYHGTPVGFSEETQTRPVYSQADSQEVIAHELAHQWFGDSVSLTRWQQVWLNEGFATFASWYWDEYNGGVSVAQQARQMYAVYPADSPFWQVPVDDPGVGGASGARVYYGGAMALEFLRERMGDRRFFALLRAWASEHRYGNVTTPEFAALANRVAGEDLGGFFQAWIFGTGKPPLPVIHLASRYVRHGGR